MNIDNNNESAVAAVIPPQKNDTMDSGSNNNNNNEEDAMELVKSTWDKCCLLNNSGKKGISVLQVAWEMGRRGYKSFGCLDLPDSFSWDSELLIKQIDGILVRIIPDEILLMIMEYLDFSGLLRFGMVCRKFARLWKDESLHKRLCSNLGIRINIVHPSLPFICLNPWFECSIRMEAWARARTDNDVDHYLKVPRPMDRILAKDIGGLNPLGCYTGVKVNDYEIMRTFTKGIQQHPSVVSATACVFCKEDFKTKDMYYNLAEGKSCFGCYNYIRSNQDNMYNKSIYVTCFDKRVPCTYCRGWIEKLSQCLTKAYAVICNDCWSSKGFHLRVIIAQKIYNLNRKDKKLMWVGRTMLNPCKYLYSEEEKEKMSTSNSQYILGEDARAQAVIKHGSLRKAMQKGMGTLHRRMVQRKKDIRKIQLEIFQILYLDHQAGCHEIIKKALLEGKDKAQLIAELLDGKEDFTELKKTVEGETAPALVHGKHQRLMYLNKLDQEDESIENMIQFDWDYRSSSSISSSIRPFINPQKRSRESLSSSSSSSDKKKDQKKTLSNKRQKIKLTVKINRNLSE